MMPVSEGGSSLLGRVASSSPVLQSCPTVLSYTVGPVLRSCPTVLSCGPVCGRPACPRSLAMLPWSLLCRSLVMQDLSKFKTRLAQLGCSLAWQWQTFC